MFTCSNGYWEVYRRFQGDFSVGGGVGGEWVMRGELSMEKFFIGKQISMKGVQDFLAFFEKNDEKINMKKFFSTESKEQH